MFPLSPEQLLSVIGGVAKTTLPPDLQLLTGVTIDSRSVRQGDIFFALPGSRQHGVEYAAQAVQSGAACVVVDSSAVMTSDQLNLNGLIEVPDCRAALWKLAEWNRQQTDAVLIAVTGSVGKTTTRQMIAAVLSEEFRGIQSPASFNNELGVPLSLLLLSPEHEFGVLEIGASAAGEIARLAGLVQPELSVVTRVAEAHLEGFGTIEGVQRGKQELVEATSSAGVVFLNADDERVLSMRNATSARVVLFGNRIQGQFSAEQVRVDADGLRLNISGEEYLLPEVQRHLVTSVLATVAVATTLGLSADRIRSGLAKFKVPSGRGNTVMMSPWFVVDDAYNASPASVVAAATSLAELKTGGKRILVLGDMLELGNTAETLHFQTGKAIASLNIDHVMVMGEFRDAFLTGFCVGGTAGRETNLNRDSERNLMNKISVCRDLQLLTFVLDCFLSPGDVVWVKGSRGVSMERVVRFLISLADANRESSQLRRVA
ncbi:MAG: UDP-N-acetylmuramoyl-tripeptide--D-alanyl-D-alanine ligase [Planctomyces sp.]|nr:UDP-N-acetylmuramoyl-tripeptide--D-alanyl-D-alanine ligase [Planctomyces sp.]